MKTILSMLWPLALLSGFLSLAARAQSSDVPLFAKVPPAFPADRRAQVFEVAVPLAENELLVVTERLGTGSPSDAFVSAQKMKASYQVVVLFEPGSGQGLMVKFPNHDRHFKDLVPASIRTGGGALRIELADARTKEPRGALIWSAKIEKMDGFASRYPQFTRPKDRGMFLAWSSLGRFKTEPQ